MVTIIVNEILNWVYSDYKDVLVQTHIITKPSIEDCFKRVYALRRSARYDSARRYEFDDPALENKYNAWKSGYETIENFYGSSPVD